MAPSDVLRIRDGLLRTHSDVLTPAALDVLAALAPLDRERRALMDARMRCRAERARDRRRITFLDPASIIGGTDIRVQDARDGHFTGSEIPASSV